MTGARALRGYVQQFIIFALAKLLGRAYNLFMDNTNLTQLEQTALKNLAAMQ